MARQARVPLLPVAAVRRGQGWLLKVAAATPTLRFLFRLFEGAVLYSFLAAAWVGSFVGGLVKVLGRWASGEGSRAEAVGDKVMEYSLFVLLPLFPVFFSLLAVRIFQRAEDKEEGKAKVVMLGTNAITMLSDNEQHADEMNGARPSPSLEAIMWFTSYVTTILCQVINLAYMMKDVSGKGSILRSIACVLYDFTWLAFALFVGFIGVPSMLLVVLISRAELEHTLVRKDA